MKLSIKLSILFCLFTIAWACKKPEEKVTPVNPSTLNNTTKSSAKDITKFSFATLSPVVDAKIDGANKAISSTLEIGVDLSKLVPTISISDKATVSPASGTMQDFSKEVKYTVTAEDGSTQVYSVNLKINQFAVACKLNEIKTQPTTGNPYSTIYEYDSKNRLKKYVNACCIYTFNYDENDYLLERKTVFGSGPNGVNDKYTYKDGRLSLWETSSIGSDNKSQINYEYNNDGSLSKKISTGANYNETNNYKDGILESINSNTNTYEINTLGLITKSISKSTGTYSVYKYDNFGKTIRSESFSKDGKTTRANVFEYSEFKELKHGIQDINTGKGFPTIGVKQPSYHLKKSTTLTADAKTGALVESSNTYENYKLDNNGRILSRDSFFNYPSLNISNFKSTETYNYTGCN